MKNDEFQTNDFSSLMKLLGGVAITATGAFVVKTLKDSPETLEKITATFLNFFNNGNNRLE